MFSLLSSHITAILVLALQLAMWPGEDSSGAQTAPLAPITAPPGE